jgi:hypothetical protein
MHCIFCYLPPKWVISKCNFLFLAIYLQVQLAAHLSTQQGRPKLTSLQLKEVLQDPYQSYQVIISPPKIETFYSKVHKSHLRP